MAKNGNRLGTKPASSPALRESQHKERRAALELCIEALQPLNAQERTNVLAATAEFYALSLTVEN